MAAEKEKRVPVFEWITGTEGETWGDYKTDLQGRVVTVTESEAVEQVIVKAMRTIRGLYLIYADPENTAYNHKYGNETQSIMTRRDISEDVRLSELQRAIKEALEYDPWVLEVNGVTIARLGSAEAVASFTVVTIFDRAITVEGVTL